MKKSCVFFSLISVFLTACSSAKVEFPEYISDCRSFYDQGIYLSAAGEGKTKTQARENAVVELSRYLNTSISSNTTVQTRLSDTDGKLFSSESVSTVTSSKTDFSFTNLEYSDFFEADKTFYVAVYIEREKAYTQYNVEAKVLKNEFMEFWNTAENSDPLSSYSYYLKAQEVYPALLNKINVLTAISPGLTSQEYGDCLKKAASLEAKKKNAFAKSPLSILPVENDFENIILSQVESSLRKSGLMTTKGNTSAYKVSVYVDLNKTAEGEDDDVIFVAMPSVQITINYNDVSVFSFNTKVQEKTMAFTGEKLQRESLKKLAAKISQEFKF